MVDEIADHPGDADDAPLRQHEDDLIAAINSLRTTYELQNAEHDQKTLSWIKRSAIDISSTHFSRWLRQ
jgi:hypothetical protein